MQSDFDFGIYREINEHKVSFSASDTQFLGSVPVVQNCPLKSWEEGSRAHHPLLAS